MDHDRCDLLQMSSARSWRTRWKSGDWPHKRGRNTKVHVAVDAFGMPIRAIVTDGTTSDCKKATELLRDLRGKYLFADKGYDSQEILDFAEKNGMKSVIPPRKSRKIQRYYDKNLYKARHLVENLFLKIKQWRGVAFRYAKNLSSFQSIITIAFIMVYSKLI